MDINYLSFVDIYEEMDFYGYNILKSVSMQKTKKYLQHGNVSVYEHSVSVAIMCLVIAKYFHINVEIESLIRGALLHDYFLYDWHIPDKEHKLHGFTHARRALSNAERDFELNDIERNMILCHMFPLNIRVPKYKESVILCIADKICATREIFQRF